MLVVVWFKTWRHEAKAGTWAALISFNRPEMQRYFGRLVHGRNYVLQWLSNGLKCRCVQVEANVNAFVCLYYILGRSRFPTTISRINEALYCVCVGEDIAFEGTGVTAFRKTLICIKMSPVSYTWFKTPTTWKMGCSKQIQGTFSSVRDVMLRLISRTPNQNLYTLEGNRLQSRPFSLGVRLHRPTQNGSGTKMLQQRTWQLEQKSTCTYTTWALHSSRTKSSRQPVQTFVEAISSGSHCRLNEPLPMSQLLQFKILHNFCRCHGIGQILFVGKNQQHRIFECLFLQHLVQFLLSFLDSVTVRTVHDINQRIGVLEVISPKFADPVLPTYIPNLVPDGWNLWIWRASCFLSNISLYKQHFNNIEIQDWQFCTFYCILFQL